MNGFIVSAINKNKESIYFISNTSPILWDKELNNAKLFNSYNSAKNELEDNFISLSATLNYTHISSVIISEYVNNVEMRRYKFL